MPEAKLAVVDVMPSEDPCCCDHPHLTEQEVVVLELVAQGLANSDIGRQLHLSGHTIAGHVGSAMRRLRARSRAELVARAYVSGLLAGDIWPPRGTGRRCYTLQRLSGFDSITTPVMAHAAGRSPQHTPRSEAASA